MYVKTDKDGRIEKFPYRLKDLRVSGISIRKNPPDEALASLGIFPVIEPEQPEYDPESEMLLKNEYPTKIGDKWEIGYTVIPISPEQIEKRKVKMRRKMFCDKAEFRIALLEYDIGGESLFDKIAADVQAAGKSKVAQRLKTRWQDAATIDRLGPLVRVLVAQLAYVTDTIMDEVFEAAMNQAD